MPEDGVINLTAEANVAYIGEGVSFKGAISVPEVIVIDGLVDGDITARTVKVGPTGSIKGNIISTDAEIFGVIKEKVDVKQLLIVRSTGRIEGQVSYGEIQVEKGAVIGGAFESTDFRTEKPKAEPPVQKKERLKLTFNGAATEHEDIKIKLNGDASEQQTATSN